MSYELGSNTMLDPVLDEALDGLSAGENRLRRHAGSRRARGQEHREVKVNSVKAEELPELNDEFASEASEFDTLDELKADIRKAAAQDAEGRPGRKELAMPSSPSCRKASRSRCRRASRPTWSKSSSRA